MASVAQLLMDVAEGQDDYAFVPAYYDARSLAPPFGERDRGIHDDVNELRIERRNGGAWYGTAPARAIERHAAWSLQYPAAVQ